MGRARAGRGEERDLGWIPGWQGSGLSVWVGPRGPADRGWSLEPQGAGPEGPDPRRGLSLGQAVCKRQPRVEPRSKEGET